jgi:hypothetical protein
VLLGVGSLTIVSLAGTGLAGAAAASTVEVHVSLRPQVPAGAAALGALASSTTIRGDVALLPVASLAGYAAAVSNPHSSQYERYLSLAGFDARFAPSPAAVGRVEHFLQTQGVRVTSVTPDNLLVGFSGTAKTVEAAFHTSIESYRLQGGRHAYANESAPEFPADIASSVEMVIGLSNIALPRPITPVRHNPAASGHVTVPKVTPPAGAANPCAAASSLATQAAGLTANNVAYAYGLDPLYTAGDFGQAQTVDIFDLFGYATSDIVKFNQCYYGTTQGSVVASNDSVVNVDGGAQPGIGTGGSVETTLDVDTINALAPKAKVAVYEAPDTNSGFIDDMAAMSSNNAKVESISYGGCEQAEAFGDPGFVNVENDVLEQAAILGKTVFVSSGDSGNAGMCASDPASQPYATSVGGTATTAATNPPSGIVWNDGNSGGAGGGGISAIWAEPSWEDASTVPGMNNSTVIAKARALTGSDFCQATYGSSTQCREEPDVSAQASPNIGGEPIVLGGQWFIYGGTSLASPMWAAVLTEINATTGANGCSSNGGAGFVSPKLYAIASIAAEYKASFSDITLGNNDNEGDTGGLYPATAGYDMASGLGSPIVTGAKGANGLAYYLCTKPAVTPPTVTGLAPPVESNTKIAAGTATLDITGSGFTNGSGTSQVARLTIGNVPFPSSALTVTSTSITLSLPKALLADEAGNGGSFDGTGDYDVTVTLTGGATSEPSGNSRFVVYDTVSSSATPVVDGTFPQAGVSAGGNTVTIYGSGFDDPTTGLADVTSVTFGGTHATSFTVDGPNTITAVTPAEPSSSKCVTGDDPTTGVCQVQVRVVANGNDSAEGTIPLEFSGDLFGAASSAGIYAAPTEFDFVPTPHIANISTGGVPASEEGGTLAVMTGTGLGVLGLEWINVGSYLDAGNENYSIEAISETSITFELSVPSGAPTSTPTAFPVTVQTYGSPNSAPGKTLGSEEPSNVIEVPFAPTPNISSSGLSVAGGHGVVAGPTVGGSVLTILGSGLDDSFEIVFIDPVYGFESVADSFTLVNNGEIKVSTPAALTGVYDVEVCGISGCSSPSSQTYTYYVPGNPSITASTPTSGPAGTTVTISGDNLGFVKNVYFGTVQAAKFSQTIFWEDGDTYQLTAVVPPGKAGSKVDIQLDTVESLATGYGKTPLTGAATFTYATAPAAPQDVSASAGKNAAAVSWKAPKSDGGAPITAYVVTASAKGEKSITLVEKATVSKVTVSGLAAKVAWTLKVAAHNAVGTGPSAAAKPVTPS